MFHSANLYLYTIKIKPTVPKTNKKMKLKQSRCKVKHPGVKLINTLICILRRQYLSMLTGGFDTKEYICLSQHFLSYYKIPVRLSGVNILVFNLAMEKEYNAFLYNAESLRPYCWIFPSSINQDIYLTRPLVTKDINMI